MRRPVQGRQRAGQRRCRRGRAALPCVKVLYPFIHSFTSLLHSFNDSHFWIQICQMERFHLHSCSPWAHLFVALRS